MGSAFLKIVSTLNDLTANINAINTAINSLTLSLATTIKSGQFTIIIAIASLSRADFDALKAAIAPFEVPGGVVLMSVTYTET